MPFQQPKVIGVRVDLGELEIPAWRGEHRCAITRQRLTDEQIAVTDAGSFPATQQIGIGNLEEADRLWMGHAADRPLVSFGDGLIVA